MLRPRPRPLCGPSATTGHSASIPSGPRFDRAATFNAKEHRSPREQALRVLLVEDSDLLVQRITELLNDLPNIEIVGVAASEADALARLEAGDIDAVILDLQLHTGSGFGILRALRGRESPPAVVVFTNFAIGAYRDTALALGAQHFLDKSRDYHRLPAVLQELSESMH
jgi:two-component system, OmpR family, response regulator